MKYGALHRGTEGRFEHPHGFTLMELIIVIALIGILSAVAIPGIIGWMPDYRLKSAANDLFSNMQLAKMGAIKDSADWAVEFDTANNRYIVYSDWGGTDTVEKTVELSGYQSGVGYGHGAATKDATTSGGTLPGDDVSYTANRVTFNSRGTCKAGYVYLDNEENTNAYTVGTRVSGVIRLRKWDGTDWK